MNKLINLPFINNLQASGDHQWELIQVVVGPRQVGKTTGVLSYIEGLPAKSYHYVSADGLISKPSSWLLEQWTLLHSNCPSGLLIVDEIQKIENWSEIIKSLWDSQKRNDKKVRVLLLGSSSLEIQKGLSESLTGRFYLHRVPHWNLEESLNGYGLSLEQYLLYGGYPGSYRFIQNRVQWLSYIKDSIVDTVIGRDILQLARVKSPSLFKQCFELACSYGGQEISYTKLLGQLQDKGNVELVKHYLELFEGAFLLRQLPKFSQKKVLTKASSPKILPMCPALYTWTIDAELDSETRGRAFEIAVGCELSRLPGNLFYWREGPAEVDFVYSFGKKIYGFEVKSGNKKSTKGLAQFAKKHPKAELHILTPDNYQAVIATLQAN